MDIGIVFDFWYWYWYWLVSLFVFVFKIIKLQQEIPRASNILYRHYALRQYMQQVVEGGVIKLKYVQQTESGKHV